MKRHHIEPTLSMTTSFAHLLKMLRTQNNLTQGNLAKKAGLPVSLLSELEAAKRGIGQRSAAKLVDALALKGNERLGFVEAAIATSRRGKIPSQFLEYDRNVLLGVAQLLMNVGIDPGTVFGCVVQDAGGLEACISDDNKSRSQGSAPRGQRTKPAKLRLMLRDGRVAKIEVRLTWAPE